MMLRWFSECQNNQCGQPDYQFKIYLFESLHDLHNTNMTQRCLKGFIIIQKYAMIGDIPCFICNFIK